ncbi:transcriptional regulator, GntR family [Cetobacterium ceti]|uniref:Transcriptional regulator, GntR family n=1 Tax=Cetobacterium ceti TaxID=180163 RepID=A0A1T4P5M8_9FUSO|nr:FCD domain-containing protein [Cetobacterium ceti]SJZ86804.1 transcriptional regulator, GntR family [Cetobacterium ceti]
MREKPGDKVLKYLEEKIFQGFWKPGDKIDSENYLAELLGVSRVSVREAISKMVAMGLLIKKRGGGSYVKEITPVDYMDKLLPFLVLGDGDYIEILQLRMSLDVLGVKLFIENKDEYIINELKIIHKKLIENKNNPKEFFMEDMNFHKCIMKGSKNLLIYKVFEMIVQIMGYHAKEQYFQLPLINRIDEHNLILEAILNEDIEIAQIYMKRHLERTISDLKRK